MKKRIEIPDYLTVWRKIDGNCYIDNHGIIASKATNHFYFFSLMEGNDLVFYEVEGTLWDSYEKGFYANEYLRIRRNEYGELTQEYDDGFGPVDLSMIDKTCMLVFYDEKPAQAKQGMYLFAASLMKAAFSIQDMQKMLEHDISFTISSACNVIMLFARGVNKYFLSFIEKGYDNFIMDLFYLDNNRTNRIEKMSVLNDKNIKNIFKLFEVNFPLSNALEALSILSPNEICEICKMFEVFTAAKFISKNPVEAIEKTIAILHEAKKADSDTESSFSITKFANYVIKLIVRGKIWKKNEISLYESINALVCNFLDTYWDYLRLMNETNLLLKDSGNETAPVDYFPDNYVDAHDNAQVSYTMVKDMARDEISKRGFEEAVKAAKQYEWAANDVLKNASHEYAGFAIIAPNDPKDLILESHHMNNCVKTYADMMAQGRSFILFMRSDVTEENPEGKSYITIELRKMDGEMVMYQAKREYNYIPSENDKMFLEEWARRKDIKILYY